MPDSNWEDQTLVTSGLRAAAASGAKRDPHDGLLAALAAQIGDKYEVLRRIGGGGMAEVYLARHRKHGGLFAVKVLSPTLASHGRVVARFLQEARTAAKLSGHPNIVSIFDVGEGNGLYYIIMQYVDGEDLDRYLARAGRMGCAEAIQVVRAVAEALAVAAANGIVHRDIKPANIRVDPYGRVVVLDFGIAKAKDVTGVLTLDTDRLGTPYYMCPEQIRGELCDQRSDIYSLGIVFFELLASVRPFLGDSHRAIEDGHLLKVAQLPGDVDPECSRIVMRMIAKDPAKRYQTASELLLDLRSAAAHGHGSGTQRKRKRAWRRSAVYVTAALLGAGLMICLAVRWPRRPPVVPPPLEIAAPMTNPASSEPPRALPDPNGDMVLVHGGEFIFGDNSPESPNPRQQLTLPAFAIDATEVSNAVYQRFCEATGHAPPDSAEFRKKPDFPVVNVTLEDSKAFAAWAGKRLPTEQEWEKAARGVDGRIYPWGNQPLPAPAAAQPVISLPDRQSPCGALHMAGNVWEWTVTKFPETERDLQDARDAAAVRTVSREWFCIKGGRFPLDPTDYCRLFMRRGFPHDWKSEWVGFRCVRDVPNEVR